MTVVDQLVSLRYNQRLRTHTGQFINLINLSLKGNPACYCLLIYKNLSTDQSYDNGKTAYNLGGNKVGFD